MLPARPLCRGRLSRGGERMPGVGYSIMREGPARVWEEVLSLLAPLR